MERKEAIKIVKSNFPYGRVMLSEALETLIPELQESEDEDDDDGIRKDLIEFVQQYGDKYYGQFSKASAISWLERQGESSKLDTAHQPHEGDADNPYDMSFEDAQHYAGERGIDVSINDGDVFVDEGYITQTIGNILRWADEHPKIQKREEPKFKVGDWIVTTDGLRKPKIIG